MLKKSAALALPPCAVCRNVVNSTMTKISSHDAPARIICGMLLSVPRPLSISCTMRGTTTAGDTAASTEPMTAASTRVMPRKHGASIT